MSDFRDLRVWQKAHQLMLRTHQLAETIRGPKYMSLKKQMYRAAESIPANIVESRSHESVKEAARFLRIALNSATELEYHILTARDLGACSERHYETMTEAVIEVRKMLYGLIRSLSKGDKSRDVEPHL